MRIIIALALSVILQLAGCRTEELSEVIEAVGGQDQVICSVESSVLVVCGELITWVEKYEEIYGADLAAAAVGELTEDLDLFEGRPVGEIGAWAVCPAGPVWIEQGPELEFTAEIEPGFGVLDESQTLIFLETCGVQVGAQLDGITYGNGGSYSGSVDSFVANMDEFVAGCVDATAPSVSSLGNDLAVAFTGELAGQLYQNGAFGLGGSAGRAAFGATGSALGAVVSYVKAVTRFFSGMQSFRDGNTDFWSGTVDPQKAVNDEDYADGFQHARGVCMAKAESGAELPESCKNGLHAMCDQGDAEACAALEQPVEEPLTENATPADEEMDSPNESGAPGTQDSSNPDPAGGLDNDSFEPGVLSACEKLAADWDRFKEYCESTGWNDYDCLVLVYAFSGCPDPALVYPDPQGGNQCIVAMTDEELAAQFEAKACELRKKVAVVTSTGEHLDVDCESFQTSTTEERRLEGLRARCRFMLTDGGICGFSSQQIELPGRVPEVEPGRVPGTDGPPSPGGSR